VSTEPRFSSDAGGPRDLHRTDRVPEPR
jgi:hypothetical protein